MTPPNTTARRIAHVVDSTRPSDLHRFREYSNRRPRDVLVELGAMCNGIGQMVATLERMVAPGSLHAVILYGHGAPGVQGVSIGTGKGIQIGSHHSTLTLAVVQDPGVATRLGDLGRLLVPKGVVALHGCNVAQDEAGRKLLAAVAKATNRTTLGSDWYQVVGHTDFLGKTYEASPKGQVTEFRKGSSMWSGDWSDDPVGNTVVTLIEMLQWVTD